MSNTNYDVELNISYNNTYRHYIPTYRVAVPYYKYSFYQHKYDEDWDATGNYAASVSFDTGSEEDIQYGYHSYTWHGDHRGDPGSAPSTPWWNNSSSYSYLRTEVVASGVFSKIYFRNPNRSLVTFTRSNCYVDVRYTTKAPFEVQLNSSGYIGASNASFKCSTIEKNTYKQYEWTAATVYYKKSSESSYSSVSGTVSGTWSDVTVSTNLSLATGYTYNIYIKATADDGSVATTNVNNFATTDGTAVATCVSPVGVYTNGTVNFIWSHATEYGTRQYAYDLQYSSDNGGSWTTVANHVVSSVNNRTVTISSAGVYVWRVRTYNTLNVAGSWAQASFINNIPAATPTNLTVTTKGRPTVSWTSTTQAAYQVQFLLSDNVVYDSGAVYTGENYHFVNEYFDDSRAYTARVRIYNSLGSVSEWASTGYQQPEIDDVVFVVTQNESGGASIEIEENDVFDHYYIKRNDVVIAKITNRSYTDKFAVGITNYSVVGVTAEDQSDIKTNGIRVTYPCATVVKLDGGAFVVNKRVGSAFEIQTTNDADFNKMKFIGASRPAHFFNKMKLKSFRVNCFDDQGYAEDILGTIVFYADNFENGGFCMVTNYEKTDSFIKNGAGVYANEVSLTLEDTLYDDSIEYSI